MRKYLLHVLIISFVFLLAPTVHVASHAGELEDAKEEVRKNPDDALAHFNLGVAYENLGMYKEAIEPYKQAIKNNPDYEDAAYRLGFIYGKLRMWKEVIEFTKQEIRNNPDLPEADLAAAYFALCIAYHYSNDSDSALEQYKILKSLDPSLANKLVDMIYK